VEKVRLVTLVVRVLMLILVKRVRLLRVRVLMLTLLKRERLLRVNILTYMERV